MREIKFRVKKKNEDGYYSWMFFVIKSTQEAMEDGRCFNFFALCADPALYGQLDHETWGQYTGLKDKNGKEIYEGGIVKWEHKREKHESFVYWDERTASFRLAPTYQYKYNFTYNYVDRTTQRYKGSLGWSKKFIDNIFYEVIGNIYENPELLE